MVVSKVNNLTNTRPVIDANGVLTQEARLFFNDVTALVMITGNGSPENVVESLKTGVLYTDLDGTTGSILYVKKLSDIGGDTKQGWILV